MTVGSGATQGGAFFLTRHDRRSGEPLTFAATLEPKLYPDRNAPVEPVEMDEKQFRCEINEDATTTEMRGRQHPGIRAGSSGSAGDLPTDPALTFKISVPSFKSAALRYARLLKNPCWRRWRYAVIGCRRVC
jgi:hypothetical protein